MSEGRNEILELAFASLMDCATEEQEQALLNLVENDAEARSQYLDFMLLFTQLHRRNGASLFVDKENKPVIDPELVKVLLEEERRAPAIEPVISIEDTVEPEKTAKAKRLFSKRFWPLVALTSIAAMIVIIVGGELTSRYRPYEVATLEDSFQAKWDEQQAPKKSDRFKTNSNALTLRGGIVKVRFDNDVQAVIEGPAQFEIRKSDHLFMYYGDVYTTVPPNAIGFLVSTNNAKILDLGTEFGIHAKQGGDTELHVTSGLTELSTESSKAGAGIQVTEGIAKQVNNRTKAIATIKFQANDFVRDFVEDANFVWRGNSLDLDDIVYGGNGFGVGDYNGVPPLSSDFYGRDKDVELEVADGYQAVEHPFIDGIFVPDGKQGPIYISSKNHVFEDCPKTSGLSWFRYIEMCDDPIVEGGNWVVKHSMMFDGKEYRLPENRALLLHASSGITFDLEAMRKSVPGREITHFTSRIGLSDSLLEDIRMKTKDLHKQKAGFHVLIDGRLSLSKKDVTVYDDPQEIDVTITKQDRFLTLVTTGDYTLGNNFLWCLFADPILHLE